MSDYDKMRALRGSGLAKGELKRIVQAADPEEQQFMLKFFKTADLNSEIERRTEIAFKSVNKVLDAAYNASNTISDLEDAEAFIKAVISTIRGIVN